MTSVGSVNLQLLFEHVNKHDVLVFSLRSPEWELAQAQFPLDCEGLPQDAPANYLFQLFLIFTEILANPYVDRRHCN